MFFNFHPRYIQQAATAAGFRLRTVYSLSNFRSGSFKKVFGTKRLVWLEKRCRKILGKIYFGPSIVLVLEKQ